MTGFIQRLVSRGTGQHLQTKQVTLQPRPRSRFESDTVSKIFDSSVPSEIGGPEDTVTSENKNYSNSPTSTTQNPTPDSKIFIPKSSPVKSSVSIKESTSIPLDHSNESDPMTESRPSLEKSPDIIINSIDHYSSINTAKRTQAKKEVAQTVAQDSPDSNPTKEQKSKLHEHTKKVRENPVSNLFKVIEEHNSRVTESIDNQNDSSFEGIPAVQNKIEFENSSFHKPSPESLIENHAPLPGETQKDSENLKERTNSSEITISIGQIQVEFIQPETGMRQQPKPTIHRTQGFDGYSRARRGNPRR